VIGTDHDPDDWRAAGGNVQSVTFYTALCNALLKVEPFQAWATWYPEDDGSATVQMLSIHDYGCAHGDGTAVLQATFPMADITGIDISEGAIAEAMNRWPTLNFRLGDIREPNGTADVIVASHVIEHMDQPVDVMLNLREYCGVLVVVLPTITDELDGGHTDAVLTDDIIDELGKQTKRYATTGYLTLRSDAEHPGYGVIETNNVFVLEGGLVCDS
jgi:2-polyprenyl-3-methyl-5-hydroxy-6-metoxy-1,4-benzoquinol methylase